MTSDAPLVSIGLPIRNGARHVDTVVRSALAQDHDHVEVVISDNASTDDTEEVCRELAQADERISYFRQPANLGLLRNFVETMRLARGDFFRWVGHDDALSPDAVTRPLELLMSNERLLLATAQTRYLHPDGEAETRPYTGEGLGSEDGATRVEEVLRVLGAGYLELDPLTGLMRRERVASIERTNFLREDEVFAVKLALAGPWGHVPKVLTTRQRHDESAQEVAGKLEVPAWQVRLATARQLRELLAVVSTAELDARQRRRARSSVAHWYLTTHRQRLIRFAHRKVARLGGASAREHVARSA